jgi:hypothetical protein
VGRAEALVNYGGALPNESNLLQDTGLFYQSVNELYDILAQVCKNGAFIRNPEKEKLPKCGYLHHFNPYLRLGPFKVEVIVRSPYIRG